MTKNARLSRLLFPLSLTLLLIAAPHTLSAQLLYEISGNSTKAKSYLLATNRLTDISFLDSIPNVFKCYERARCVVTEFAMQDYEAIAALRQAALLPDSVSLNSFYSPAEYKAIDEALNLTLGMGLDKIGRMKPSFLVEMYRTELMKKWAGFDEQRSVETFFEMVAQQRSLPIYGLDDIGETMYMTFEREPMHHQCKELKDIIESPEKEVKQEKNICALYKHGRLNEIAIQVLSPNNTSTISYSDYQVYARRNDVWVKRLQPYLKDGKAFITLNAVYLGGEDGLIAKLKAAGYRVRPVNRK